MSRKSTDEKHDESAIVDVDAAPVGPALPPAVDIAPGEHGGSRRPGGGAP